MTYHSTDQQPPSSTMNTMAELISLISLALLMCILNSGHLPLADVVTPYQPTHRTPSATSFWLVKTKLIPTAFPTNTGATLTKQH
jgi:hypothetical protein